MKRLRSALILASVVLPWVAVAAGARAQAPSQPEAQPPPAAQAEPKAKDDAPKGHAAFDAGDCKACHDAAFTKFERTAHAEQAGSCAYCHGDAVVAHLQSNLEKGEPGPVDAISLKKKNAKEINSTCLDCHAKAEHPTWAGGAHDRRGVACTDCHSVHQPQTPKGQLKTAFEPDTCNKCHNAIRAQSLRTSHHPVREGLMTCSSCHNVHDGSKPKLIRADWTNELCLQCHTEKRGPFLWEHAPVRENCLHCHNPHGSNHDKLLVSQQPWLCQRCHLNTRHPGTLYSSINAAGTATSPSNRAVEHACKNCHQNVHGGNAPSGPYLGR
jgi:DmsE family decaheme c-type cytochrome